MAKKIILKGQKAAKETSKSLKRTEREIKEIYQQAEKEVEEKLQNHLKRFYAEDQLRREALDKVYKSYQMGAISYKEYLIKKKDY